MAEGVTFNYEQDIEIDTQALDVEWVNQPELVRRYSKEAARLEKLRDQAKEALAQGKARIEMKIRSNPEDYGISKLTENSIASAVLLDPEYQQLSAEYIDAQYEYNVVRGVVQAFEQKKSALENLVKLLGQSYFAGPKAPRNLYQEQIDYTKRRRNNAKVRMTRTRKGGSS